MPKIEPISVSDAIEEIDEASTIIMDDDDARQNDYREAAKRSLDFFKRGATFVKGHKHRLFAFDCWLLAMGWYDVLGCNNATELSRIHKCTDANVTKCVKIIQSRLGHGVERIEPMPGQRSLNACQTFKKSRKSKLIKK